MNNKIEFIESYIKIGNSDYQWHDNHGELVRCGNCKYCYYASNRIPSEQTYACGKHGINVTRDWFCADGKAVKWDDADSITAEGGQLNGNMDF